MKKIVKQMKKAILEAETDVDFAIMIKRFRIKRGMSREKFAKATNIPLEVIIKLEDGWC